MYIITTLHDLEAKMLPLVELCKSNLQKLSGKVFIAHTVNTPQILLDKLKKLGFVMTVGGGYGEGRLVSLKTAVKISDENELFFCVDFDKVLHWLNMEPVEFERYCNLKKVDDFLLLGRSRKIFSKYPKSWRDTESVVNQLFSERIGVRVDTMAGTYIFNKKSAEAILKYAKDESWGAAVEWPIVAFKNGFNLGYKNAKGLSWEDPDRNQEDINKLGYQKWLEKNYNGSYEWQKRFRNALEQLKVMDSYNI